MLNGHQETAWTRTQDYFWLRVAAPVVLAVTLKMGFVAARYAYELAVAATRWGDLFGVALTGITGLGLIACGIGFGYALLNSAWAETRKAFRRVRG